LGIHDLTSSATPTEKVVDAQEGMTVEGEAQALLFRRPLLAASYSAA
jgi:hypothetical protein